MKNTNTPSTNADHQSTSPGRTANTRSAGYWIVKGLVLLGLSILSKLAFSQLSGNYTVGGTSPDYVGLATALYDLTTQGANGDVTFSMRPGNYHGQFDVGTIPGSPGTITIKSETGSALDVTLQWDATGPDDNHVMEVDGTDHLTLKNLTFWAEDDDWTRALVFHNGCDHLTVDSCMFIGSWNMTSGDPEDHTLLYCDQAVLGTGNNSHHVAITNCFFNNADHGVRLDFRGNGTYRAQDLEISGNYALDQRLGGIKVQNAMGRIERNDIRSEMATQYKGVELDVMSLGLRLMGNRIQATATGDCVGIDLAGTSGSTDNIAANNMVYVEGGGDICGLLLWDLGGTVICNNSVVVNNGPSNSSRAVYHVGVSADDQDTQLRNNLFVNYAGGPAIRSNFPNNLLMEDHDLLFSTGSTLVQLTGTNYADLNEYQSGTSLGEGSISLDPGFPALPDLHVDHCALDNAGVPVTGVVIDFDNEDRDANTPDIGADEFAFDPVIDLGPDQWDPLESTCRHASLSIL